MKKVISFRIEQPKHRAHRVLFENDTPYKPKVVRPKNVYKRKDKHQNKFDKYSII
jgi:hypothetical protein